MPSATALTLARLRPPEASRTGPAETIFDRLVRRNTSGMPSERAATELLRSVLITCPLAMSGFTRHLAERSGVQFDPDSFQWDAETELPIAGKRDDLRLEGLDQQGSTAVFTIEVKVESGFHYSSPTAEAESDDSAVLQLTNYDAWLVNHGATHKGGFVLARSDTAADLAEAGLSERWKSLRWYDVVDILSAAADLAVCQSAAEAGLLSHAITFFRREIAATEDFLDSNLDLTDLSLLQAYAEVGRDTQRKIKAMVEPLTAVMDAAELAPHAAALQDHAFGSQAREVVWASLTPGRWSNPFIYAGVATEGGLCPVVWIESSPNSELKRVIGRVVSDKLPELQELNEAWTAIPLEDGRWWDVELRMPLGEFLAAKNQATALAEFAKAAFADLAAVGLTDAVRQVAADAETK